MLRDTLISILISFAISVIFCPIFIPILHRLKFGQPIREDGPQGHLKKQGTPTMGGIVIVIAIIAGTLPFINKYEHILPVLIFTVLFGFIGFIDDYLKVVKKKNEGLKVCQKLIAQIIVTVIFLIYLYRHPSIGEGLLVPFTGTIKTGYILHLGMIYFPIALIAVLGTDNGVNFTDGLDGLCSTVTIVISIFFIAASIINEVAVAPIAGAVLGSLLGFLIFNAYPAKVFMGDTGSLALGGFVAAYALIMQMMIFIPIVGFIYMIEVISVIIQVVYFKKTGGKRFFKMAPIHHHFELSGWSEVRVVTVFAAITSILSILSYIGFGK